VLVRLACAPAEQCSKTITAAWKMGRATVGDALVRARGLFVGAVPFLSGSGGVGRPFYGDGL
jgi:hypothetical protein